MKTIPLHGKHGAGLFAIVDNEDYEAVANRRWFVNFYGYVFAAPGSTFMHRLLLGLEKGDPRQGDHLNRNPLDNRRENLRIATHAQNSQNCATLRSAQGFTSRFRGVYWDKRTQRWCARVQLAGAYHWLGRFADELDAAHAAQEFRREHMPFAIEGAI